MEAGDRTRRPRRPRRRVRWLVAVGLVLLVALPVGYLALERLAQPDSPSSFYDPPEDLADGQPGTVIRTEELGALSGRAVRRMLYTSTDPNGVTIAVSGIVVTPTGGPPDGGWPIVGWAHGTTGILPRCAPSLESGGGLSKIPELDRLVDAGAVVVATDYPGLGTPGIHPYLVGESEGRALLDALRAARQLLSGQAASGSAVYGHSQGGHAVLFAAELAPTYAPDLDLVGTAAMAPPTALGTLVDEDEHAVIGVVLISMAIESWSRLFPTADPATVVHDDVRATVRRVGSNCVETAAQGLTELPEVGVLHERFLSADPATAPGWSSLLEANSVGRTTVRTPVLVAQGLSDELVDPAVTERWVDQQCAAGAAVELRTYAGVGHFAVRDRASPAVADWILARLAGVAAATGCSTQPS